LASIDTNNLGRSIADRLRARPGPDAEFAMYNLERCLGPRDIRRMAAMAELIPPPTERAHLVDVGGTVYWVPLYQMLGYNHITVVGRGVGSFFGMYDISTDHGELTVDTLDVDAELDRYPIEDGSVDRVVCFELLEHFAGDPMHCISEVNRILEPGGTFCLTTPNVLFFGNLVNLAMGLHPFGWSVYTNIYGDRHNREYTPYEVRDLLRAGGFDVQQLRTKSFHEHSWKRRLVGYALSVPSALARRVPLALREGKLLASGAKVGPVVDRYPSFLYELYGKSHIQVPQSHESRE
jgi:SAM-dependent methyltransferase